MCSSQSYLPFCFPLGGADQAGYSKHRNCQSFRRNPTTERWAANTGLSVKTYPDMSTVIEEEQSQHVAPSQEL